ncbi:hypothetical protein PspCFBP13528_16220 [Pseudomonas sp. CFBP13528]|nr:hypothetical protein PspCFBP13528_16220 [Pseudomonas sp. CFBP13528]
MCFFVGASLLAKNLRAPRSSRMNALSLTFFRGQARSYRVYPAKRWQGLPGTSTSMASTAPSRG